MNLHAVVAGGISTVNPWIMATIQRSLGTKQEGSYHRIPLYAPPKPVLVQQQSLLYNDLVQLDGINVEGERRAFYITGNWEGAQRADGKGGDLITLPDGSIWLVVVVLENWQFADGWVKVGCTRQVS